MESHVNRRIRAAVKKMLEEGRYEPYLHDIEGNSVQVDDIDVVVSFYGTDAARLEATKLALSMFERYKAKPHEVIIAEAQFRDEDAGLRKFAGAHGFKYVYVSLSERQRGIYIKQALLNIATRFHSSAAKLIYLDSDIGFCNPYWIKNVSALLAECDVAQPFGYSYFAYRGKYEPIRKEVEKSALKAIATENDYRLVQNTGFAWAMTRKVFDRIGGLDVLTSPSDDVWFWFRFLGISNQRLNGLPYQTFLDDCKNRLLASSAVKTNDEVCFHVEHGTPNQRRYAAYVYACNRQSPTPFCDIVYDKSRPDVLPAWKDDAWSDVRRQTIRLIDEGDGGLYDGVKNMKDQAKAAVNSANFAVFGRMPPEKRLTVVTCLDERHSKADVLAHMEMFRNRLRNPFEYVCISDEDIGGIRVVRPSGFGRKFRVMDAFREDVRGPEGVTLYASLDAIPVDDIDLCDVPDMFIGMFNPRHSRIVKDSDIWKIYSCDVMLFSGDFSFVHGNYASNSWKFRQKNVFTQPDQCIAYNMYTRRIGIRSIAQFVDASVIPIGPAQSYGEYVRAVEESAKDDKYTCTDLAIGSKRI